MIVTTFPLRYDPDPVPFSTVRSYVCIAVSGTVITHVAENSPTVAVIVVSQAPLIVTNPLLSTVAVALLLLFHVVSIGSVVSTGLYTAIS